MPSSSKTFFRGFCPVCQRWMLLNKDGSIRHHGGPVGSGGIFHDQRSYRCKGAGDLPTEVREDTRDA